MAMTSLPHDPFRSRLPTAAPVSFISVAVGHRPSAFSVPDPMVLLLGAATVYAVIRWVGKPVVPPVEPR